MDLIRASAEAVSEPKPLPPLRLVDNARDLLRLSPSAALSDCKLREADNDFDGDSNDDNACFDALK